MRSIQSPFGVFTGVAALIGLVVPLSAAPQWPDEPDGVTTTAFSSLTPCRLVDTRSDDFERVDPSTIRVAVADRCGVDPLAVAVAVTLTATNTVAPGYATAHPAGGKRPDTSNLNFDAGSTIANSAIVGLRNGSIDIHHSVGTDLILDVVGAFVAADTASSGRYRPTRPERVSDTRELGSRTAADVLVAVSPVVPADAIAVVATVTIIDAAGPGYFTVHRTGEARPEASFANTDRSGQTRAATVVAPLSPNGFTIHRSTPSHVAVDVLGYFTGADAESSTTGLFVPTRPHRALDTRSARQIVAPGETLTQVVGDGQAVIGNLTTVATGDAGFATVYPTGTRRPDTSSVNSPGRSAVSNMTVSGLSDGGVAIYSTMDTYVILDITGHFTGPPIPRDPDAAPTVAPGTTPRAPNPDIQVLADRRDPWLRPFSSTSIWNMPIGSGAQYRPAKLPVSKHHALEHVYLLRTSTADPARPLIRTGGWRDRCSGTEYSGRSIHLPDGWMPRPVEGTSTPNNPGVFVQPDGRTVVEVNGMGRCDPTGPLYGQYRSVDGGHITDIYGDGVQGNRGASAMSQFGGPIRHGELTGDEPIRHALDLLIWAEHLYWGGSKQNSYRWPASDSDSYAGPDRYRGTIPELQMGSLLALPPSLTPEQLGITTDVGRKLFAALQDYGSYVTEDAAWNATYLAVESTAIGTFAWGDAEKADMARMVQQLHVVTNNSPTSIGGGGTPRQPLLPELHPPN